MSAKIRWGRAVAIWRLTLAAAAFLAPTARAAAQDADALAQQLSNPVASLISTPSAAGRRSR